VHIISLERVRSWRSPFGSYEEIASLKDKVIYVAGGASQNTARGAAVCPVTLEAVRFTDNILQYILPPNSVVYTGCVGDDDFADQLRAANKREGLIDAYFVKKGEKTGACAVVVTGHHRWDLNNLMILKF
jgi:adenosine kinase